MSSQAVVVQIAVRGPVSIVLFFRSGVSRLPRLLHLFVVLTRRCILYYIRSVFIKYTEGERI